MANWLLVGETELKAASSNYLHIDKPIMVGAIFNSSSNAFVKIDDAVKMAKYNLECRYNAVQYNRILRTSLQWQKLNIVRVLTVTMEDFGENWPRYNGIAL